jgi:hypothetical protein
MCGQESLVSYLRTKADRLYIFGSRLLACFLQVILGVRLASFQPIATNQQLILRIYANIASLNSRWSSEEVLAFCVKCKEQLIDRKTHVYQN